MNVIEAHGVTKRYGDIAAVDDVAISVARGECLALLGPNGAGKTTLVEILEGYRGRDTGTVSVLGRDPANPSWEWKQRLGIVLQSATDLSDLTVAEVLRHFAAYYPDPRDPVELADEVGLTAKADDRVLALSGGQRRRLDVALGIIGRPEVLFLDEPTTGFDPEARRSFWELIEGLKQRGTTIVLTTHYLDEAAVLADRVTVIAAGRVVATGTPDELGGNDDHVVVRWNQDGAMQEESTKVPTSFVADLAQRFGGEVPGLEVRRRSLEDVYLQLVKEERS